MTKDYRELCLNNDSELVKKGVGCNIIPSPAEKSLWWGFLEKFRDPLIVVLLVVFLLSVGIAVYEIVYGGKSLSTLIEPAGVLIALLLATGVGFILEVRAEREFKILNKKKDERLVKVLRWMDGDNRPQMLQVKKSDVVAGDVVRLESGDEVPADGQLLSAETLLVDESAFTGEMFAAKRVGGEDDGHENAYPPDFLLRGSTVIEGYGLYQVTAIGMNTEEGKGARILQEESEVRTPLNQQLDRLGLWITKASYLIAALIVAGRLFYYFLLDGNASNNTDVMEIVAFTLNSIMIAVTLIVVAVPEGLPMSITMSLALSMRKMLKQNNLVRKLHACETMGAATVICTDKTGTLTRNRLRVMEDSEELYTDIDTIARCIAVNSTAELAISPESKPKTVGNPTEGSLLYWLLRRKGIDYHSYRDQATIVERQAFSTETKRMTTVAIDNATGRKWRYVKGAPEIVLDMSDEIASGHSREEVTDRLGQLQRMGRRTLAFALQEIVDTGASPLVFIGFVGMADPVREDVRAAIDTCHGAGVNVIMVTGDVALTASEVARQTGIIENGAPAQVVTGTEFAAMSDEYIIKEVLPTLKVMSRARPADKARLVTLLQATGQVVAVTGDGTNDAPALKKAQVGLSMGDGTARAKEASDITIIDNSFASINTAILWGRSLYLNIRRFILFQMTINVCACLIVLAGAFTGLESPLNVTQMLWVNLIMDTFAAMALSSLPADPKVMRDKPRSPDSQIIDAGMAKSILGFGLVFFVALFGLWLYISHRQQPVTTYDMGFFFTVFVYVQFWNMFNTKYFRTDRSLIGDIVCLLRRPREVLATYSMGFIAIAVAILVGQMVIVNIAGDFFGVSALPLRDWLYIIAGTFPVVLIPDLFRCFRRG